MTAPDHKFAAWCQSKRAEVNLIGMKDGRLFGHIFAGLRREVDRVTRLPQCPHGDTLRFCDDCHRERREATA